jgi:hypothetical protein
MGLPRLDRGYWAKLAAGHTLKHPGIPADAVAHPEELRQQLERFAMYEQFPKQYLAGMMSAIIRSPEGRKRIDDYVKIGLRTPPDVGISMLMMDFIAKDRRAALARFNRPALSATASIEGIGIEKGGVLVKSLLDRASVRRRSRARKASGRIDPQSSGPALPRPRLLNDSHESPNVSPGVRIDFYAAAHSGERRTESERSGRRPSSHVSETRWPARL